MHSDYTAGIMINDHHSYYSHGLHIRSRKIGLPEKKTVFSTVPYMNGFYDFSAVAGEAAWGQREIEYSFDLIADTPVRLEEDKAELIAWLANTHNASIYDDSLPYTHFVGSYVSAVFNDDDSGLGSTLTVTFVCQPFRRAIDVTSVPLPAGETTVTIGGMTVFGTVDCPGGCTIAIRDSTQSVTGTGIALLIALTPGDNVITVEGEDAILHYYAEVI